MATYHFTIDGTGAGGKPWQTRGIVTTAQDGNFPAALVDAQRQTFDQLTHGEAIYGHPGEAGCTGPYRINRLMIERTDDRQD